MVAIGEAGVDRALDRRAVRDAAARRHVDRQLRPVGGVDPQPADDQIALRHRINLSVGAIKRRKDERAAAQALRLADRRDGDVEALRSEEHTSELQSLMRISYAVFCLKKKK